MNSKIIIGITALVIVVLGILLFLNPGDRSSEIKEEMFNEEIIGVEEEILHIVTLPWKPFAYEENGEYKGIGVDIMDKALKNLDIDYNLALIPWSRALKLTEVGDADAILLATYEEDRESYLAYTSEQLEYGREEIIPESYLLKIDYVLFVKKVNKEVLNFESVDQIILEGYTIGVNQDFSYTPKINDANWNTVVHFDETNSFRALQAGEMDYFLANREVGLDVLSKINLSEEITYIDAPADSSYLFLVFSKNSDYPNLDELIKKVDKEFLEVRQSGGYDEIYDKYLFSEEVEDIPAQLFDISFSLDDPLINDINKLAAVINFESFGTEPTPVNLTFFILDETGKEVYIEEDSIVVETERVLRKTFDDLELPEGKYKLVLHTLYNDYVFDEFEREFMIEKKISLSKNKYYLIGIFAIILAIILWFLLSGRKKVK